MSSMNESIFARTWWTYDSAADDWFTHLYHWFNLLEGCIWLGIAILVMVRFLRHRRTSLEVVYALAFCAFALTDFREAWEQSTWLIGIKLLNLILLFRLRQWTMSKHYPAARIY